jgi:hypothetical protein
MCANRESRKAKRERGTEDDKGNANDCRPDRLRRLINCTHDMSCVHVRAAPIKIYSKFTTVRCFYHSKRHGIDV